MEDRKRLQEHFELALIDVLETDYDLEVRRPGERVNRRRDSAATLLFDYAKSDLDGNGNANPSETGSVEVRIDGFPEKHSLKVDWSTADGIEESAGNCESLAMAVGAWLEDRRELSAVVASEVIPGPMRRWDD